MKQSKGMSTAKKAGIGAGIAATAVAAALGAYFLYGKDGAKNRKKVKGWMLKAKGEILERVEDAEVLTEGAYGDIVKKVMTKYKGMKNVSVGELAALASDLKKHWQGIKSRAIKAKSRKPARSASRKTAKKRR